MGVSVTTPPRLTQPAHTPLENVRCHTPLSVPRTKTSMRPPAEPYAAGWPRICPPTGPPSDVQVPGQVVPLRTLWAREPSAARMNAVAWVSSARTSAGLALGSPPRLAPAIRLAASSCSIATPCAGTVAVYEPVKVPSVRWRDIPAGPFGVTALRMTGAVRHTY